MPSNARLDIAERARSDVRQCRHFLRRRDERQPLHRVREVVNALRFIQANRRLHPVEATSLIGLSRRRRKAGQFVLVYAFIEPSPDEPGGIVSVRAIRHQRAEDVFLGVSEQGAPERHQSVPLILK